MASSTLRPFRDYDEHDVINLYKWSGTIPAYRGTIVSIIGNGWTEADELEMLGSVGASYANVTSQRYGVAAAVRVAGSGDATPLGMLLHDVKETDENGEKLIYNPRKAAEMEVSISGHAAPIVARGIFLYSGSGLAAESPTAGQKLYVLEADGALTTGVSSGQVAVGKALGAKDSTSSHVLIKLEL